MRTIAAATLAGLTILLLAGCGPDQPSAAGPSSAKVATKSTADACDAIAKASDEATGKFADELTGQAAGAAAQDPAAQQRYADAVRGIFTSWSGAMRSQIGAAGDAELDGILREFADALDQQAAKIRTHADLSNALVDTPEIVAASEKLDKKCA